MVALTTDSLAVSLKLAPSLEGMAAELTVGGREGMRRLEARVMHLGRRSMEIRVEPSQVAGERMMWVDLELPDGSHIRPLVEVVTANREGVTVRIRHVFPDHRELLARFHHRYQTGGSYYR